MSVRKPPHTTRYKGPKGDHDPTRGVIIHTTEGGPGQSPEQIVDYLAGVRHLSVPVVCGVGGRSVQMVPGGWHGEHAACVNGCYGIEQCAFAAWGKAEWGKPSNEAMMEAAAEWSAYWLASAMGLPVTEAILKKLVIGHAQDYKFGGCSDHWDPGPHYPWDAFRAHAIAYAKERGFRVEATKGDLERARYFRPSLATQARAWLRKWRRRGWHVVMRRTASPCV